MIAPGGSYLVTPISDFGASRDATGKRTLWPYMDEGMDRIIKLFETQHAHERIEASLDSIIFEDGTLVGPDTANRMDKVNSRIRAERDLIAAISGLRGDDLRKQLARYSELQSSDPTYSKYQNMAAGYLLRVLDTRGEPAALAGINKFQAEKWFGDPKGVRRNEQ